MSHQPPDERPMRLPAHPEADETPPADSQRTPVNWAMVLVLGLIGTLVVVILILHLTGAVGPGGHQ
jgi:hypothetical protein